MPAQLTRPEFMASVESWARREARARILSDYLDGLTVEEMISPTRAGAVKSVFEIWLSAEHSAAKARHDLGLDPSSWASIQQDLGIAGRAADDRLAQLGEQGGGYPGPASGHGDGAAARGRSGRWLGRFPDGTRDACGTRERFRVRHRLAAPADLPRSGSCRNGVEPAGREPDMRPAGTPVAPPGTSLILGLARVDEPTRCPVRGRWAATRGCVRPPTGSGPTTSAHPRCGTVHVDPRAGPCVAHVLREPRPARHPRAEQVLGQRTRRRRVARIPGEPIIAGCSAGRPAAARQGQSGRSSATVTRSHDRPLAHWSSLSSRSSSRRTAAAMMLACARRARTGAPSAVTA